MEITGEKLLAVPRPEVWRALNDPAVLKRCLPGCDTFEPDGDNRYRLAMQATVGPVRARFAGKLELRDVNPPTSYELAFEGSGGVAGFGKGTARVQLEDAADGTRLRYESQAQVGGRLAQVGARLIDGVTRRMADDFFGRFANELAASGNGSAASVPAVAPTALSGALGESRRDAIEGRHTAAPSATAAAGPLHAMQVAVIAAAVSATAAAVAVLAAVVVIVVR